MQLENPTENQIINTIIGRILIQRGVAYGKYLNDLGKRCAIGVLLPDRTARYFSINNGHIEDYAYDIHIPWINEHIGLLADLQETHDILAKSVLPIEDSTDASLYVALNLANIYTKEH